MTGSYDFELVLLSLILAVSASYAALSIASRLPFVQRERLWLWLSGGALSMGLAIWSMHFVGMLAFHLGITLAYDLSLTGLSMLYAIVASAIALALLRSGIRNLVTVILASGFMAAGIAAMHYTGMAALRMTPPIVYDTPLFVLSLVIAYAASFASLQLFFSAADSNSKVPRIFDPKRLLASVVVGVAIAGMHYTAMEAAIFQSGALCGALEDGIGTGVISVLIVLGVIMLIMINILLLLLDSKFQDIRKLTTNEERVSSIINSAPQGMMVVDASGNIIVANRRMRQIIGYAPEELIGLKVEQLIPHEMRSNHTGLREMFIRSPATRPMGKSRVLQALHRDGHRIPVEIGLSQLGDDDESLTLTTLIDVSERMVLEQEVESNRQRLIAANQRILLATDSAEIGIWEFSLADGSLIWDDWMYRIYGLSSKHGTPGYDDWKQLVHTDDLERIIHEIDKSIQDDAGLDSEFRIVRGDDEVRWIKVNGALLYDTVGKPKGMIGINQDVTDKIEQESLIWQQANYDSLTGLPNRKLLHELLEQEIRLAHRHQEQLWLLFLDLDGFKQINDTLGHHAGDDLLQQVAGRIKTSLRESDVVARLGGDEFVVIISSTKDSGFVDQLALKLIGVIAQEYQLGESSVHITTSIGIANYPNDAATTDELLAFADQSMYAAKEGGKNRYTYFTPELQAESVRRNQIANELRRAIANQELEAFYQPIIDLANGKMYKAEALVRWRHPERGIIPPDEFITVAEETGLITSLGSLMFDLVFSQLQTWKPLLGDDFQFSINMSPFQLKVMPEQYDDWLQRLEQCGIRGSNITIEITEGMLLKSDEVVNQRLLQYRDAGVQVAIDDFGTGYSSLAYLKEFHIDYLKIDKSFTLNLQSDSSQHTLSEAIIVMAHKLGLKVIAEGVETEQQLDLLREMKCDFAQGYFYSRPLSRDDFARLFLGSPAASDNSIG
jgi:diguanylate cyclase (GGDEF)-like protein/PAS domain S-box-containing protein